MVKCVFTFLPNIILHVKGKFACYLQKVSDRDDTIGLSHDIMGYGAKNLKKKNCLLESNNYYGDII